MKRFYAGIGSRNTPLGIQSLMMQIAEKLSEQGYVLRSGGADGADRAFESKAGDKEIFYPNDAKPWAIKEVQKYLPTDRSNFNKWKPYVQNTVARNMMQILGEDRNAPVGFVVFWAPSEQYQDSSAGGTGYGVRCAIDYQIPIYNLYNKNTLEEFLDLINSEEK